MALAEDKREIIAWPVDQLAGARVDKDTRKSRLRSRHAAHRYYQHASACRWAGMPREDGRHFTYR